MYYEGPNPEGVSYEKLLAELQSRALSKPVYNTTFDETVATDGAVNTPESDAATDEYLAELIRDLMTLNEQVARRRNANS